MTARKTPQYRWHELTRGEPLSGAEWLMLGVSAVAMSGAVVLVIRVLQ